MTIQEAIKSGKPFRQKCWNEGIWVRQEEGSPQLFRRYYVRADGKVESFRNEWLTSHILSTDWEIKP